jgi:hypothetical protein
LSASSDRIQREVQVQVDADVDCVTRPSTSPAPARPLHLAVIRSPTAQVEASHHRDRDLHLSSHHHPAPLPDARCPPAIPAIALAHPLPACTAAWPALVRVASSRNPTKARRRLPSCVQLPYSCCHQPQPQLQQHSSSTAPGTPSWRPPPQRRTQSPPTAAPVARPSPMRRLSRCQACAAAC